VSSDHWPGFSSNLFSSPTTFKVRKSKEEPSVSTGTNSKLPPTLSETAIPTIAPMARLARTSCPARRITSSMSDALVPPKMENSLIGGASWLSSSRSRLSCCDTRCAAATNSGSTFAEVRLDGLALGGEEDDDDFEARGDFAPWSRVVGSRREACAPSCSSFEVPRPMFEKTTSRAMNNGRG